MTPQHAQAGPKVDSSSESAGSDPRLADAVEQYRTALRAGQRPDRQEFCAAFPDLAGPLAECLDALEFLHAAGPSLTDTCSVSKLPASRPGEVRPGELLGDFRILREVGRGGMAVVYAAEQVSLGRHVALKVLPLAADTDPRRLQRFQNEARAAGCLHHPNIVPVYAVGSEDSVHFYAMQLIDGQTVADLIANLTASSIVTPAFPRTVARFGSQAALALEHAHRQGIVHRDVKPANLLVDHTGKLYVTDFGLAHLHGDAGLTATGDLVGTLRYMSPEQVQGVRTAIDHRTDIYSLGATLYEFLTLRPAFAGGDPRDLLRRIAEDDPPLPRRIRPAIPDDLEVIVLKAMAKEPADRYATAQDLADDLRRFLDDWPIQARRPSPLHRLRRWAKRHRSLVASLAVTVMVLIVGLVSGLLWYAHKERESGAQVRIQLYRTLLGESRAVRLAHEPGYRRVVWENLREAAMLDVAGKDRNAIAREVLACLGDPIGLDPVTAPTVQRRPALPLSKGFEQILGSALTDLKKYFGVHIGRDQISLRVAARDEKMVAAVFSDRLLLFGRASDFPMGPTGVYGGPWQPATTVSHHYLGMWESPFGAIYDVAFDEQTTRLVAGCEGGFCVWEMPRPGGRRIPGGDRRTTVGSGNALSVAMHPDGWLTAILGRSIELWTCPHGRPIATLPLPEGANRVEFSADGKWLLAVNGQRVLAGWPVGDTPERRRLHGHEGAGVPAIAFSPDGRLFVSASKDRTVKVWDTGTGQLKYAHTAHTASIEAIAFSPDGRLLATGDAAGVIFLWDIATGARRARLHTVEQPPGQVWRLQFDGTGRHLAAGGVKGVAVWSVRHRENAVDVTLQRAVAAPDVLDVAIDPGGSSLAYVVRSAPGAPSQLFRLVLNQQDEPRRLNMAVRNQLRGLNFDPSGRLLTFVTPAGKLGRLDWTNNTAVPGPDLSASQWVPAPGGRWAAASSSNRSVHIYDLETGAAVLELPPEESDVWTLAWSPDRRGLAVGTADGVVAIWNLERVRAALAEFGIDTPDLAADNDPIAAKR
jgi:serine/threonine protein kinase/WD40 repeat protein